MEIKALGKKLSINIEKSHSNADYVGKWKATKMCDASLGFAQGSLVTQGSLVAQGSLL
jgi:hypothetical protein